MRYARHITFQATTGPRWPAWRLVGPARTVHGDRRPGLPPTQAVLHPDRALGSQPGDALGPAHGRAPRRRGPRRLRDARLDRTGLPHAQAHGLAVVTLWVLAHGTRVEEARLRGLAPGRVRRPPLTPAAVARDRPLSLFQLGRCQLCLGPGLAAAPAGTGPARRAVTGGSADRAALFSHKDADWGFTYPYQRPGRGPVGKPPGCPVPQAFWGNYSPCYPAGIRRRATRPLVR